MKRLDFLKRLLIAPAVVAAVTETTAEPVKFIDGAGVVHDNAKDATKHAQMQMRIHGGTGKIDKMYHGTAQEIVDKINNDPYVKGFVKAKLV